MLLTLPAHEVPWSADQKLAPLNAGTITTGRLATTWVYLEQVVGATVSDTLPPGYLIPKRGASNNTYGMKYPTDVAQIQCNCTWVAPTLPAATNVPYMNVSLEEFDISALQTAPNGVASMSISRTRFALFSVRFLSWGNLRLLISMQIQMVRPTSQT